jgi:DNA-binding PadR family transcriptional regulator
MSVPVPDETILGILAAGKQHGYQILSRFHSKTELGRVWSLSTSQLYAVLKRLEGKGFIRASAVYTAEGPPRRDYSITASGRRVLDNWLNQKDLSSSIRQVRVQFISRLYVARLNNKPVGSLVANQRRVLERQLADYKKEQTSVGMEPLVLDFVKGQLQAVLTWLDSCEELFPIVALSITKEGKE